MFTFYLHIPYLYCLGVFLHDPRCACPSAKSITRLKNKNKDDCVADSLYWPAMPRSMVMQYPEHGSDKNRQKNPYHQGYEDDSEQQPHSVQPYCVPVPQQDQYHLHDAAVYSMWMHFVDFCLANSSPASHPESSMCFAAVDVGVNPYARSKRLPVFRTLCTSQHVQQPARFLPSASAVGTARDPEYLMPQQHQQHREMTTTPPTASRFLDPFSSAMGSSMLAPISPPLSKAPSPVPPFGAQSLSASPSIAAMAATPFSAPPAPLAAPASPAVLVRRQSTSSPVSVINTSALEMDDLPSDFEGDLDMSPESAEAGDCGGLRLQRQNLPQNLVSPMILPSLF